MTKIAHAKQVSQAPVSTKTTLTGSLRRWQLLLGELVHLARPAWEDVLIEAAREDSYPTKASGLTELFESHMHDRGSRKPFRLAAAFFMRNNQATGRRIHA